jgi:hypothetical protein
VAVAGGGRTVGTVLDPGVVGPSAREGVVVDLVEPAWLVLAESYNRGWRARCDGRDLGEPSPVDGFANGWRAPADCREVRFDFSPQRVMDAGYAISGLACAGLLALVGLGWRGRRRRGPTGRSAGGWLAAQASGPAARVPLRLAVGIGLAAGLVGGLLFALRAGAAIGPAVALLLWRGVGPGRLAVAAGLLAGVAAPAAHLFFPARDNGGFNSDYANELLGAHWIAVAVWVLLAVALSRAIPGLRARARRDAGAG